MVKFLKTPSIKPKLSVVIPVYNSVLYLEDSLKSILSQTYKDFEIIIINDGSTDSSSEIIRKIQDSRIRYVSHRQNKGLVDTLNEGLRLARGEYVARMDPDDIAMPDRLEKQVRYLDDHISVDLLGSWIDVFGKYNYTWKVHPDHETIAAKLLFENSLPHPSMMFRRSRIKETGYIFEDKYKGAEDYMYWSKLIAYGLKSANIQETLLKYRTHEQQISETIKKQQQQSSWKVRKFNLSRLKITPSEDERVVHQKLSSWQKMTSSSEIQRTSDWLLKILDANKRQKIYDVDQLKKIIGERWVGTCFISTENSIRRILYIFSKPKLWMLSIMTIYKRSRGKLYR